MFSQTKFFGVALAACVAVGISACGADESKAPKITFRAGQVVTAISQDDDTIIKGVTISGRNGKCKKQAVHIENAVFFKDMETCVKTGSHRSDYDENEKKEICKPIFDGEKISYGYGKGLYDLFGADCPPKNGAWRIELDTNFGTYAYELKE